MGYLLNGKYHKGSPPMDKLKGRQNSTFQQHDHARQRKDFSREIIQPYNPDGTPNQDYIQAWPDGAKDYGFIPKDEDLRRQ